MNPSVLPTATVSHRHVLRLAIPIMLANLTQPIMAAVDTAVAGHLPDPAYLGGVALGGLFFSVVFWGFGFLRMGTTGLTAQAYGAADGEVLRATLLRALMLAAGIGVVLIAVRHPAIALALDLLGGSASVQTHAAAYSIARIYAAPFALANYVVLGYLLGCQRVRLALALQVFVNLVNIVAVLAYVYGLGWRVAGIGAATATADTLGFAAGAACLWRLRWHGLPALRWRKLFDGAAWRRLLRMNTDIFLRTLFLQLCLAWFARAGARQGDTILAANALLLNFQTFMAYALDGFAHATETLVGASIGARRRAALRDTIRIAAFWSAVGAALFTAAYVLAGPRIIEGLTDQAGIRAAAMQYLPWVVVSPLCSVASFILDGVFIGATRTRELMVSVAAALAVFGATAIPLQQTWGNHGLWIALLLFMLARGVTLGCLLPRLVRGVPVGASA